MVSYKDSLGLPASPSLHNVWAGYSCSASLRGLLIQTVHIMQKLRPSRHYGNSHPNTVSNAYLFHSLVQILRLLQSPLFQMIPQCLRLSLGFLLYLKRTRNFLFFAEQQKIIIYLKKKKITVMCFPPPWFFQGKSKLQEICELHERSFWGLSPAQQKGIC